MKKNINVIQDLYSPSENIEFNKRTIRTIAERKEVTDTKEIKENIMIEDLNGRSIVDVDIVPVLIKQSKEPNRIMYNGELQLKFMLMGEDLQIVTKRQNIPFEYTIDNVIDGENLNVNTNVEIMNQDFIIQENGEVFVNVQMKMNSIIDRNVNINTINEIQANGEREEQDYSIIMYIVKKDDTLWNIAKKFGSTIDDIVRVNGIEDPDNIYPGQKLFIPRYKRSGVSSNQTSMINYA